MTAESNASNIPNICSSTVSHKWYTSSTGSTTVPSFIESAGTCAVYKTRINVNAATSYWVSVVVNGCESGRVQVNASYQSVGSPASVTGASICGSGVATISAAPGVNGNSIRWYTTSNNPNEIQFATGFSFTTPSAISTTTTYYVSSFNTDTGCTSPIPRTPVTITVNPIPANPLGTDGFVCGSGPVTLAAQPGVNGNTVRWYSFSPTNIIATGLNFTTPCVAGEQLYMTAESNASNIPNICSSTVSHKWYTSPTGNATVPSFIESAGTCAVYRTRINVTAATSYWVSVVVNGCESGRVQVNASYQSVDPPVSVTGATFCGSGLPMISAVPGANANSVRWYLTQSNASESAFAIGLTFTPPSAISTTTTYYVTSFNTITQCESPLPRTPIQIIINPIPALPVGNETFRCGPGTVNMTVTPGINGNDVKWYSFTGNFISSGVSFTSDYMGSLGDSYTYYIATFNSTTSCESAKTSIKATVKTQLPPVPPTLSSLLVGVDCFTQPPGTAILTAVSSDNGSYNICGKTVAHKWYTSASGSLTSPSTFLDAGTCAVYTTRISTTSNASFWVSTVVDGCESDRAIVEGIVTPPPISIIATNQVLFSNQRVNIPISSNTSGVSFDWTVSQSNSEGAYPDGGNIIDQCVKTISPTIGSAVYSIRTASTPFCAAAAKDVTVTIYPAVTINSSKNCIESGESLTMSVGSGYDSYEWKCTTCPSPNTVVSTTQNCIANVAGVYTLKITKGGASMITSYEIGNRFNCGNMNFLVSTTILTKNVVDHQSIVDLLPEKASREITYFDGLGRQAQVVSEGQAPTKSDAVKFVGYDDYGRIDKQYLPFSAPNNSGKFVSNPMNNQQAFYSEALNIAFDSRPYTETMFEPSPLNRPDKDFGAGQDWYTNNKHVKHAYLVNVHGTAAEEERIVAWKVDGTSMPVRAAAVAGYVEIGGYYSNGQLSVKSTKDEQGNVVREYVDKEGRTILKKVQAVSGIAQTNNDTHWAMTYYIYDDLGNLVVVLPPEAVKTFQN